MDVTLLREDEKYEDVMHELFADADTAIRFDCADPHANFVQVGWFVFPRGSLAKSIEVELAS